MNMFFILFSILFNQVGYYPNQEKIAVVQTQTPTGKVRTDIDFSSWTTPGVYTIEAGDEQVQVSVKEHPLRDVLELALHAYYLQRSGEAILPEYAGIYARELGHPDTKVLIHPSAAGPKRKAGDVISSPRGWYDAGDYNKYIVNSGFTIGVLLNAWEMQSEYLKTIQSNIPEKNNSVPDYLDEIWVNLQWMLTMQDPNDGGVYHKLTTPDFEAFISPSTCHQTRYVVQKSTPSALDFAAVMAMAARIYKDYPETKDFAKQALKASTRAFDWALKHPTAYYDQPGNNIKYDPDVTTGMYGDMCAIDEFFWAATELYITTGQKNYNRLISTYNPLPATFNLPSWGQVAPLALYSAIAHNLQGEPWNSWRELLLTYANESMARVENSAMHSPHGNLPTDFYWGSNGEQCAGQGVALMMAYRLTGKTNYRTGALENMDWLLGRNTLGYCYVTGLGTKQVMNPHHRLSASDNIEAPLPGFLVGGPNPGKQDAAELPAGIYPDTPDECYLDLLPSYATNEVAINWNAYLVALCTLLDANL